MHNNVSGLVLVQYMLNKLVEMAGIEPASKKEM